MLDGGLSVDSLTPERAAQLAALAFPRSTDVSSPQFAAIVSRIADIFQSTVLVVESVHANWHLRGAAREESQPPDDQCLTQMLHSAPGSEHEIRVAADAAGAPWTIVPIASGAEWRHSLLIARDWRLSLAALRALAARIDVARPRTPASRRTRQAEVRRFAEELTATFGMRAVSDVIVSRMASALGARLGSVAVLEEAQTRLAIRATYGYPHAVVEHLRFSSGEGAIGQVLQTGRPVVRRRAGAGASGRVRYRTASFVAIPLRTGSEVIGVVCLADPIAGAAFARDDLSLLHQMIAPATLALARERAVIRAETHAHAAAIDPVSGLFNRRYFHIRIQEELQRSGRHQIPVALLMIDLDDFKAVNDSFGHLVGDLIIRETAEILRRSVRVFDVCTRFGGEEFAIIMPGSGPENAGAVAERIRARLAAYRFSDPDLASLAVTVSIGIGVSAPDVSARELVSRADQALYFAKRAGKNRVHHFTPPPT